jgi:hypothetical protein
MLPVVTPCLPTSFSQLVLTFFQDKQILMSGGEDMKTIVSSLTDLTPQAIFPSGNFVTDLLRISEDMVLSTSYDGSIVPIKI